ncbi:hypothetical protein C8R43DRAFT_905186, partial [Mycena crocata]
MVDYEPRAYPGPPKPDTGSGNKSTKASIKIAGLNISGHGNLNVNHRDNKWYHIWQEMRDQQTGVLIVGEAHMNNKRRDDILTLFGRVIHIEFSADPETSNAKGVAFVLNKNMVNLDGVKQTEIIPGRAALLNMKDVDGGDLTILGVYAPNAPGENAAFWVEIKEWFIAHPQTRRPDLMGGDMNIVEDGIDRVPAHPDNQAAVTALDELKTYLQLIDGWRETFPTTRKYTYHQKATGSQSRIDRFYIKRSKFEYTMEWEIRTPGVKTDHKMISLKMTTKDAPTIGHGRWIWPIHIIKDKVLTKFIHEKGMSLEKDFALVSGWTARDPRFNKQTLWAKFKSDITEKARERAKVVVPELITEIAALETKLDIILADDGLSEEERKLSAAVLTEKLAILQQKRHDETRWGVQVMNKLEGEIIGRYWSRLNKAKTPRDIIHRLRKPQTEANGPVLYETNSKKMAKMARDYHNRLQADRPDTEPTVREEKIKTVLGRTAKKVTPEQAETLKARLTLEDVRVALRLSANHKSPGLDGILYELWKTLDARYQTAVSLKNPGFNILKAMLQVYNDIEIHGMVKGTRFSESWMNPLYKKNDKADIANYRPISLLNTDYKVFTKALTLKL